MDLDPEAFVMRPVEEFLQSRGQTVSPRRNVEEYCVSSRLNYAISCYMAGKRAWAFYHLDKTLHTSKFRRRRMLLRLLFWLPPGLVQGAMSLRTLLRAGLRVPGGGSEKR
jgi:hypothetical protein